MRQRDLTTGNITKHRMLFVLPVFSIRFGEKDCRRLKEGVIYYFKGGEKT